MTIADPVCDPTVLAMSEEKAKTVLVAGGCGYIGSHTLVFLLQQKYNVVVVDNLVNSSKISLDRVCEIVGIDQKERERRMKFYDVDICNEVEFRKVFTEQSETGLPFFSCIHFAGLKVSVLISLDYRFRTFPLH
jgi:UDP-glucose 4-epimerase